MRSKRGWAAMALAAAAAAGWWMWSRPKAPQVAAAPRPGSALDWRPRPPAAPRPAMRLIEPIVAEPGAPVIDEVTVDKTEVCRGEQNFMSIKAHTEDGSDAFLAFSMIDPESGLTVFGSRIPFRQSAPGDDEILVSVEGKRVTQRVALPAVTVKDCDAPLQASIKVGRGFDAMDRVHLTARLDNFEFAPTRFEWDFGDGQRQTTATPEVDHSYEGRDQSSKQSSFVVQVKISDGGGRQAIGTQGVGFANLGFVPMAFLNEVPIAFGVRDPKSPSGELWLYHGYSQPVRFERVTVRDTRLEGNTRPVAESRSFVPEEVLGFADLPAHESRTVRGLNALRPSAAGMVRQVDIEGRTADGKLARGSFTLVSAHSQDNQEG
jgi:hypothetical protein